MSNGKHSAAIVFYAAYVLLLGAFVRLLYSRGGPYFDRPPTIVEHVTPQGHVTRDGLLLLERVRPLLPRKATVTCFRPLDGRWQYDIANFLTAVGTLPQQLVLPPFAVNEKVPTEDLPEFVVAVSDPFTHPSYRVLAEFPGGRLYKVMR